MVNIRPLPPLLAEKAKEELNEDPEKNEEDIRILREWIAKQPHLKSRIDDQFLLSFIRSSKHSLERAKTKLDLFYTVRTALPVLFQNRDPSTPIVNEMFKLGVFVYLPQTYGEDGPKICLIRPGLTDPAKHTIYNSVMPGAYANDLELVQNDNLVVAGVVEIIDLANVTMGHFFQFDAMFMKKMSLLTGDASPLRHKGTHFLNTPPGFETVFNMFKGFMNEKQKSRLFVHGSNMQSLYNHVPQRFLPKEYGGENGSLPDIVNYWEKTILDNRDYFLEDEKYGTNEALRQGKSINPETLFGVDGTFRKLNVD